MENIILIETSTALCSASLVQDGKLTGYKENSKDRAHASLTAVFVKELLEEAGITLSDCSAVCVSMGPGSYTGLRVGVSTAKGLCFGAGIPLLATGTLDTLVWQAIDGNLLPEGCQYIVPMIDARRMEVYSAIFSAEGKQISETAPAIIDEKSFNEILEQGTVLFIGDGAEKTSGVIKHPNAHFIQCFPKASSMQHPAIEAYKEKRFKDVAYFEPFYLKEFVATVSKKNILSQKR